MECLARAIIRRSARSGYAQHRVPAPRRKHRNADGWRQLREVGAYAIELPQARQGRIVRTSATAGVVGTILLHAQSQSALRPGFRLERCRPRRVPCGLTPAVLASARSRRTQGSPIHRPDDDRPVLPLPTVSCSITAGSARQRSSGSRIGPPVAGPLYLGPRASGPPLLNLRSPASGRRGCGATRLRSWSRAASTMV
jgi:hypothetical protein